MADPTALDLRLRPKVLNILETRGATARFYVNQSSVYDVAVGDVVAGGVESFDLKVSPPSPADKTVDIGGVQTQVLVCIVAAMGMEFVPSIGQRMDLDSQSYFIVSVNAVRSGEQVAAYELTLRQ